MRQAEVIRAGIDAALRLVHTILPGEVVTYTPLTQRATIDVKAKLETAEGVFESLPPIPEVPVVWPRGTAGSLHIPLAPGDGVLVLCCEQDPAPYLSGNPAACSLRRHGFFPFALPGIAPVAAPLGLTAAPATAAALVGLGGGIYLDASGIRLGSLTAADPVVLQSMLLTALASAASAAALAAVEGDGGAAAFAAFGTSLASAVLGNPALTADPLGT